jgi:hypothetical protein
VGGITVGYRMLRPTNGLECTIIEQEGSAVF